VADEAGLAVQTIYAIYGSKANILRALRASVRDDPEADEAYRVAISSADPGRMLDGFAHSVRLRWEAGHDIVVMHIEAASVDTVIRAELAQVIEVRQMGIARLAKALVTTVPSIKDAARAAAVIDALSLPEAYARLTLASGWTPDAYEDWLSATLRAALLHDGRRSTRTR
jgi:hypothetical protein